MPLFLLWPYEKKNSQHFQIVYTVNNNDTTIISLSTIKKVHQNFEIMLHREIYATPANSPTSPSLEKSRRFFFISILLSIFSSDKQKI